MIRALPFALLLLPLTACGDKDDVDDTDSPGVDDTAPTDDTSVEEGLLAQGFEADLDRSGGCSDTWLQAWDSDGGVGLEIYRSGILEAALAEPVTQQLTVGVDDFVLKVEVADPVADNYCTDALVERTVHATYTAISGQLTLTMQPPANENAPGIAGFSLSDVVFEDEQGHRVTVESFSSADINVVRWWGG